MSFQGDLGWDAVWNSQIDDLRMESRRELERCARDGTWLQFSPVRTDPLTFLAGSTGTQTLT